MSAGWSSRHSFQSRDLTTLLMFLTTNCIAILFRIGAWNIIIISHTFKQSCWLRFISTPDVSIKESREDDTDLVHVPEHEVVDAVPDLEAAAQLLLTDALQELQLVLLCRRQQLPRQSAKRKEILILIKDDEGWVYLFRLGVLPV